MLAFLPSPILLIINCLLLAANGILISTPIMILGIFRFLLPIHAIVSVIDRINYYMYRWWVINVALIMSLTNKIDWKITGDPIPDIKKSCVVISNHQSWVDIIVLCHIYRGKIPTTKFFMKHSLIYIPFIGLACYALGMPFLRRYSREKLLKNPKLRQKDMETTKKACKRLAIHPSSLINFVEGTRWTPVKAKAQRSSYRHLMPPKAASVAVALGEIGNDVDCILNTTLVYPENTYPHKGFIDLLMGRFKAVRANIEVMPVTEDMTGDYLGNKEYKRAFTNNLKELWVKKDELIDKILEDYKQEKQR